MHIKRLWAALCAALFLLGAVPMTVGAASSYLEAGDKTYFKTRQAQRGGTGEGYASSLGTRVNLMWFDQSPTNSYIDKMCIRDKRKRCVLSMPPVWMRWPWP